MAENTILDNLKKRSPNGKLVKWLCARDGQDKKISHVWMQPITLAEHDRAYVAADKYVNKNLQVKDDELFAQALNLEILSIGIRDAENHDEQLFSAHDLRSLLTLDEIGLLEKKYNLVTVEMSPIRIIDSDEKAEALIQDIMNNGTTQVLEEYYFRDVLDIVNKLSKEVKRLNGELNNIKQVKE